MKTKKRIEYERKWYLKNREKILEKYRKQSKSNKLIKEVEEIDCGVGATDLPSGRS